MSLFVAINDNPTGDYVSGALGNYATDNRTKVIGTGITQSARVSVTKTGVPLKRPEELMRMPREKSLLLVANARPQDVGKISKFLQGKRTIAAAADTHNIIEQRTSV